MQPPPFFNLRRFYAKGIWELNVIKKRQNVKVLIFNLLCLSQAVCIYSFVNLQSD